jgi:glycosyltransferase involved in cell wall biosynthesis
MAPNFVFDAKVLPLIHQLAADVWRAELPLPLAVIGQYLLEPIWLRRYRKLQTLTVSDSTKSDLLRLGFLRVDVVPEGVSANLAAPSAKEPQPTLLFVGRLVNTKRPFDAVHAFSLLREEMPNVQLWIAGDGYLAKKLRQASTSGVTFFGRVSEAEKLHLLKRAHVVLSPGVREGWGLVVLEANAMGTPVVGYRIPGLVDAIRDGETGLLVDPNPKALAQAVLVLLRDPTRILRMQMAALEHARSFTWQRSAREVLRAIDPSNTVMVM